MIEGLTARHARGLAFVEEKPAGEAWFLWMSMRINARLTEAFLPITSKVRFL
jgi:hypothetical protein